MDNIKIDYIIPCYYESSVVKYGLDALCRQTMKDALKVIIVNDCSPYTKCNYQDLIDEYSDRLDITVVKTPYNSGPGMAMQYGIDAGTSKYYLVQDDDDCIASDDVIENYIKVIEANIDNEDKIVSIMGDTAMCNKDFSIKKIYDTKTLVHGRLFYRKFMQEHGIRYVDAVSWWMDDYLIELLISVESRDKCINIPLDKLCYLYRAGLQGSVTDQITTYEMLCRDIFLDVEVIKFMDSKYGVNNDIDIYKNINRKLFNIMFLILMKFGRDGKIREREWNILSSYRKYLLDIIGDTSDCDYINDGQKFISYRFFVIGVTDEQESVNLIDDMKLDLDMLEDMYYTYLSNEKTMFNCSIDELREMFKGD